MWLKVDDGYGFNPKVMRLSASACHLHMMAMVFCAHAENDGVLQADDMPMVGVMAKCKDVEADVKELVQRDFLEIDEETDTYTLHDFLEYNPTKDYLTKERAKAAERMAIVRGGVRQNKQTNKVRTNAGCSASPVPVPVPGSDPVPTSKKKRSPAEPAYSPAFLDFWKAYPRKTAKGAAWKAWPGDGILPAILSALEWQAALPNWQDWQFIKHPATYLNARMWEDEKPANAHHGAIQQNLRVGHTRAEDFKHSDKTGEVDL